MSASDTADVGFVTSLQVADSHYVAAASHDSCRIDSARVVRCQPVRDVKSRAGHRNYSGLFWCATTQAHLRYESGPWTAPVRVRGAEDFAK
jgi:hypothetical protein